MRAQIVGVSATVRQQFLADIDPVVFVPFRTNPAPNAMVMVRGREDVGAIVLALRGDCADAVGDRSVRGDAYSVTQRTHETGVRMALGASARHVVWLFVRRGLLPLFIGVAIGLGGAFGVGRLIQDMLVRTSPADPVTLGTIVALLISVSVAACFWPARRAAHLDPVAALRHE